MGKREKEQEGSGNLDERMEVPQVRIRRWC